MAIETYEQAVAFWKSRVNYEQSGMPQDLRVLKLDRMRLLLRLLDNPQNRFKIIHVTGTKGKGSTSAMLASILQAAGYRTGLYTSPHLVQTEERVQINGQPIPQTELIQCMEKVAQACHQVEREELPPTFFEIITAVGLLHFAESKVDWAVLEVGLGGRFDATNACNPEIAVVTSISLDHVQQLGSTVEQIAFEKAGIIKEGKPLVIGVREAGPLAVIERKAHEQRAPFSCLGQDFDYDWQPGNPATNELPQIRWRGISNSTEWMPLPLWGEHQADNAAVALATLDVLRQRGLELGDQAIAAGLGRTVIRGRIQILGKSPWQIIDCAHNVASIAALMDWLKTLDGKKRFLLFAVSKDKQIKEMFALMRGHFAEVCFTRYGCSARGPYGRSARGADPQLLLSLWGEVGEANGIIAESAEAGWQRLAEMATPQDLICATGSVFLAGELLQTLPFGPTNLIS
jgi:dihydrofolate synthase/folylpolyglutamate synthase